MAVSTERMSIIFPDKFADATFTATAETSGLPAVDAAFPRHDSGWGAIFNVDQTLSIDMGENREINGIALIGLEVEGTGLTPDLVSIEVVSDTSSPPTSTNWGTIDYAIRSAESPSSRQDMTQPNVGPTDGELLQIMNDKRLHSRIYRSSSVNHRYIDITFSHTATPNADQSLFLPKVFGGWRWRPVFNPGKDGGIRRSSVIRPSNDILRKWDITLPVVQDDELYIKFFSKYLDLRGRYNRCFLELRPGNPEQFYYNSAMVEIAGFSSSADDILSAVAFDSTETFSPNSIMNSVSFSAVERFNSEVEL